ncbi:MAG: protein kinase [Deltaproteobacteria bacterium]|nr:protein kinase [Deltaproteobacteria bacterium]
MNLENLQKIRSVGRDELGEVQVCELPGFAGQIALKEFDAWTVADEAGREKYREVIDRLIANPSSRSPRVLALEMENQQARQATEWVDGASLTSIVGVKKGLSGDQASEVCLGILDALEDLHGKVGAHGALTPNKVLLTQGLSADGVMVTDPCQHLLYSVSDPLKVVTESPERFVGQPAFLSPEQVEGQPPTVASDIYVVGLILYYMVTGVSPFASTSATRTLRRQMAEQPLPVALAKASVKLRPAIENAITTALQKDPEQRFSSVAAFRAALFDEHSVSDAGARTSSGAGIDAISGSFLAALESSIAPAAPSVRQTGQMAAIKKKARSQSAAPLVVVNLDEVQDAASASEGDHWLPTEETDPRSPVAPATPPSHLVAGVPTRSTEPGAQPFVSKMTPPPVADEAPQAKPPARIGSASSTWRTDGGGDWFDVGDDATSFTEHLAEREAQARQASSGIPAGAKVVAAVVLLVALALLVALLANKGA